MVRTIEDVLGIGHLNLNDEYQRPMTEIFDLGLEFLHFPIRGKEKVLIFWAR
jgi:hypothetical protein